MSRLARFAELSPAKQKLLLARLGKQARPQGSSAIGASPRRGAGGPYPLSFSQQRLWFIDRMDPGASTYVLADALRLRGRLDEGALERALAEIVRRHEALRTVFELVAEGPVQRVTAPQPLDLARIDLCGLPPAIREAEAARRMRAETRTPFDLARGPQLRVRLLRLAADEHLALLAMHHIVSDGWSMGILIRELSALYAAYAAGKGSPLAELPVQYPDFADWQRRALTGEALEEQLRYWRAQLAGACRVLDLPLDRPRPPVQGSRGASLRTALPRPLAAHLATLGRSDGSTLFMILLAAFGIVLSRHSGEEGLLVGSPIANRTRPEIEELIGFFVNTLVLRIDLAAAQTFAELLGQVRRTTLGAFEHQDLPFERLVEELQPARDLSRPPLAQVSFALQNAPMEELELSELSLAPVDLPAETSPLDLVVEAVETADGTAMVWHYNVDLFDRTTVQRLAAHFEGVLAAVAESDGRRPLAGIPLLTPAERHQLLAEWIGTPAAWASAAPETLYDLFAASAARHPEAAALAWGGGSYAYGALAARADRLARRLLAAEVGPEARVGIALERSPEMVVAMLAVLGAGGAYVPLDPTYPRDRLAFMLDDAGIDLLLASRRTESHLSGMGPGAARRLLLEEAEADLPLAAPEPARRPSPESLAYVIYTSGSTGRPKGVPVRHRGVANSVREAVRVFGYGPTDRVLQISSASFDASVIEIFGTFAAGGCLHLLPPGPAPLGRDLATAIRDAGITNAILPPSMLLTLDGEHLPGLRSLIVAAEKCPAELVERWQAGRRFVNAFGPTEGSIFATYWVAAGDELASPPPIGRAVDNARIHVLDAAGLPAPIGATGELYLGGAGVVEGYLGRPERTAASFVPDPFAELGARLYRTGDLARWRADGELDFVGRADRQVKLRGLRIELGEIEAVLAEHPAVRQAAVAIRTGAGGQRLVAWVVPGERSGRPADPELRQHLRSRLPEFMVPSAFVALDELPLNPSGKLDRHALDALPDPDGARPELAAEFVAPAGDLESAIAGIWREALGVERVGSADGFFDLGGHSLLLVQVQTKLRERLGEDISMVELFRHPTVAALAGYLATRRATAAPPQDEAVAPAAALERTIDRLADRAVAIVGMAGRFPGAPDLATFWRNLAGGVESISVFSAAELAEAGVTAELAADPAFVPAGGVLDEADRFDAAFFGISPREAELLDPQQRVFLECAVEALESAGHGSDLRRGRVGVFAGSGTISYAVQNLIGRGEADPFEITLGNDKDFLATRTAYKLDLRGPAFTVQTACSTALVAVHLAVRSLLDGECEMALAGGVTLDFPQRSGYLYTEGGIVSPDGHNRAFDAGARGTVGGNGVGVVVLKPLAAALADGDPIHAVIKGSALNNDGAARLGFTTPSEEGQARAIAAAHAAAGVDPATIQYVEGHGSATPIGDPIEVAALARAFRAGGAVAGVPAVPGRCALGSVKTNIGHTGSAAGIAGLLKTVLAIERRQIPPSLHFAAPNPAIDFAASPFYVNTELAEWPSDGTPRRAGVSSFGLGGTNVHVVVEEAPPREASEPGRPWQLLVLSARTPTALETATGRLVDHLRAHHDEDLADVAFTLQAGRKGWEHRRAVVCRDREDAVAALAGRDPSRLLESRAEAEGWPGRPVAFLLAGIGEQYAGMAVGLHRDEPAFREPLERCAELLAPLGVDLSGLFAAASERGPGEAGPDLRRMLGRAGGGDAAPTLWDRTTLLQPALFAVEYALAQLWIEWGAVPRALLGYSLGEYLAACLAGVLSLADALALVAHRARLIDALPPGAMLAVPLGEAELTAALASSGGTELGVAAVNGPAHAVAAGPVEEVAELAARLGAAGHATRLLRTSHAFHSPMMAPAAAELTALARGLALHPPRIPYLSNVTGTWIRPEQATDPAYWAEHLCRTVRFGDGLGELWREPRRVLLEIGPGQSLAALALQHPAAAGVADAVAIPSLPSAYERRGDRPFLLGALARLWLAGVTIDWARVHGRERRRRVELPAYPFERQRYWAGASRAAASAVAAPAHPAGEARLYLPSWRRSLPPPRPRPGELAAEGRRWLVFLDRAGLGARIAERLAADGAEVATAAVDERFARTGDRAFTLDPRRGDDYEALLDALGSPLPDRIVHLWGLDPLPEDEAALAAAGDRGFASLLSLVHGLAARFAPGEGGGASSLKTLVVASGLERVTAADRLRPERAPLAALCRILPRELPGIVCRSVDLDLPAAGSWQEDALVEALLADLLRAAPGEESGAESARPEDGVSLAYRGGERWVRVFEPIAAGGGSADVTLRGGAVALLGRAEDRLRRAARLVAGLGYQPAIVAPGISAAADALTFAADLDDEAGLRVVLEQIEQRAGAIAGVIADFEPDADPESRLVILRRGDAEAVLGAAAARLTILGRLLAGRRLAFVLLGSSLDAFAAPAGGILRSAATALADAFSQERLRSGAAPWTAVGWEPGSERPLATVLGCLLAQGPMPQILVSTRDLAGRIRAASAEAGEAGAQAAPAPHARPDLRNPFVPPASATERDVAELWQGLLGIERVGIHDSFLELGGDSLLATQLVTRVRERFGARVTLPEFFELPTPAALAARIDALPAAGRDEAAELASILERLESLSPEEVESMLAERGIGAAGSGVEP